MPRVLKITKAVVDSLPLEDVEYEIRDQKLRAFGVRVQPTGRKSYVAVFRLGAGRKGVLKRKTLGSTDQLSCEQARRIAEELVAQARLGLLAETRAARKRTCDELFDEFLRLHVRVVLKPRTAREYERLIEKHLRPAFRSILVRDVTLANVQAFHLRFKRTPRQANLLISVLRKAMTLAQQWGWREGLQHPCKGVVRFQERTRDRLLTSEEVSAILQELSNGKHHPTIVLAIRLLMFSGCRSEEICRLKWRYVEWDAQRIRWPDTKTGGLVKPLNAKLTQLLATAARTQASEYVCPPLKGGKGHLLPDVLRPKWGTVLRGAGVKHCGIHALRHWFASAIYADPAVSTTTAMQIVGHKSVQTAARYAHVPIRALVSHADAVLERQLVSGHAL